MRDGGTWDMEWGEVGSEPDGALGSCQGWRTSCLLGSLITSKERRRHIIHARQCFPPSSLGSPSLGYEEDEHSPPLLTLSTYVSLKSGLVETLGGNKLPAAQPWEQSSPNTGVQQAGLGEAQATTSCGPGLALRPPVLTQFLSKV